MNFEDENMKLLIIQQKIWEYILKHIRGGKDYDPKSLTINQQQQR